ncbi:pentapeptide repeat-containing protein [Ensifer sp. SSB1]|uniref:pentapeptide repeat-containing protein n=1 Tax=Ensifer sp. SSB1 TaxID=2795385 RepID=UPI0025BEDBE0|nr:pentapeptide repeat-containing protein [Ensifer sp. SSB1]
MPITRRVCMPSEMQSIRPRGSRSGAMTILKTDLDHGCGAMRQSATPRRSALKTLLAPAITACLVTLAAPALGHAASCKDSASPGADWTDCNKKALMLGGSDLQGANLVNTDFTLTDLRGANLTGANLEKATLVRSSVAGALADGANFSKIEAYRCNFAGIAAEKASFVNSELQRANFSGARLTGTSFEKAELGRANFDRAELTGTRFSHANLSRASFANSSFTGPIDFDGAFMFQTRIEGVNLSEATGLEQEQVDMTCGDGSTKLPAELKTPTGWPCATD